MFGGGVKPGEVDEEMPIRASALRGQLRYWWRLLNGNNKSAKDLFDDETELWGGIYRDIGCPKARREKRGGSRASKVHVRIACEPAGNFLEAKGKLNCPDYALILSSGNDPKLLKEGYKFQLLLSFKHSVTNQQYQSVIEALRWWANFGGVGARTRRGLGVVKAFIDGEVVRPVTQDQIHQLGGWMLTGPPKENANMAWKSAIKALQDFRQGNGIGRNRGQRHRPGRSRWPEADSIRRLVGKHSGKHKPEHPVRNAYPRAAFGLPLVFHFKDYGDPRGNDHGGLTLNHVEHDRMASPTES